MGETALRTQVWECNKPREALIEILSRHQVSAHFKAPLNIILANSDRAHFSVTRQKYFLRSSYRNMVY